MTNMTDALPAEIHAFDRTVADLKQGVEIATAAQTEVSEKALEAAKDLTTFHQGTWEAFTQSGQIAMVGSQELFRQLAVASQAAIAESLVNVRAIVTAKTAKERLELQANFVRSSAVWAVSEASNFAHAGIALAEKVSAPLTARVALATETLTTAKV